jgi:hypothetical protein
MPSPLRFVPDTAKIWKDSNGNPIAIAEVTIRTIQGRYLMRPCPRSTTLILGVIAKAQQRYKFPLFGYAYLSNHGSLLLGVRSAAHLSRIMNFIHSNIARELGRKELSDWRGKFFERRGKAILVLTDDDVESRLKYLLSNGTKEGLVARPERWTGTHCARVLCQGGKDIGVWVNRSKWHSNKHTSAQSEQDVSERLEVRLSPIPSRENLSPKLYRQFIRELCKDIAIEAKEERHGRPPLGVHRAERMNPHFKPEGTAHSPAPLVHCADNKERHGFKRAYRAFVDTFREACEAILQRDWENEFPEGGLTPLWELRPLA